MSTITTTPLAELISTTVASVSEDATTDDGLTTVANVIAHPNTTIKFYWNIQTIPTPAPATVVVGAGWYYGYYWAYSLLTVISLICLCAFFAKLANQRRQAKYKKAAALAARQSAAAAATATTVTTAYCTVGVNSNPIPPPTTTNMTCINANEVLRDVVDLPPSYDDVVQVVNAKLDLQAAEEGALGSMASAISTSTTMQSNTPGTV